MISYRKLDASTWGITSSTQLKKGDTVVVTTRAGASKNEVVDDAWGTSYGQFLYKIAARQPVVRVTTPVGSLSGVTALFDKAQAHMASPKVHLFAKGVGEIKLSRAGQRARVPGSINVVSGDNWFGRILVNGMFEASPRIATPAAVVPELQRFAADPAKVAGEYHQISGKCCFCNHPIGEGDDPRSVAVGYGPDCAKHFSLPWGVTKRLKVV